MKTPTIRNLNRTEMETLLRRHTVGRIAFTDGRRVDIEPVNYVYLEGALYGRSTQGTRMRALTGHPWVAFQIDEIRSSFEWESVVVKGTVYVVEPGAVAPLRDQYEKALQAIRSVLPEALTPDDPAPSRTILVRLHIDEMEGRASSLAE